MRAANGIRECDGRSAVNCIPEIGRSFISYISGGFRASWPGSDNQLLDRDLRKEDLNPSTGPWPLQTRIDSGQLWKIGRASRRERVGREEKMKGVDEAGKKKKQKKRRK